MMFDVYLQARAFDPRARRRIAGSTIVALSTCTLLGLMAWSANRLGVSAVRAPSIESMLVSFEPNTPPPTPKPPPSPEQVSAGSATETTTTDVTPRGPEQAVLEDPSATVRPRRPSRGAGVPGDGVGRTPGIPCLAPPCGAGPTGVPGPPGVAGVPPGAKPPAEPTRRPIEAVRARAIFAPDPPQRELAATPTGRLSKKSGKSTVAFCVDERGRVGDVRTKRAFAGDPRIDAICRRTVARWRFRPFVVGNRPQRTCSEVTFEIRFE